MPISKCDASLTLVAAQGACKAVHIADDGFTHEPHCFQTTCASLRMTRPASVGKNDRHEPQISCVPDGWLDANLHRDANYSNAKDGAVPECEGEWGALKCGHR